MKNIPGISLQVGEGNPPGGDQLKIRGFNARDDLKTNGVRDLGNYFRDPFYVDQLEVIKGPNSAYSGRGSAGGTVNFVTKLPQRQDFNRAEISVGTDSFYRGTLDMNKTLDDNSAARVNLLGHSANIPGRDLAEEQRYGLYASYTWGFKGATRFTADFLHMRMDDLPDAGLPMDRSNPSPLGTLGLIGGVPAGLNYSNYYGHVDDYKKVDVDQLDLTMQHGLSNGVTLRNQLRLARVHNDAITSSPRIFVGAIGTNPSDGSATCTMTDPCARGETKPRDQVDTGINNQFDLLFNLDTGGIQHDFVAGIEFARYRYENERRRDTRGPLTSLYQPRARALGPFQNMSGNLFGTPVYDGTTYTLETREVGVYVLDTMKLSEKWDLNAGLRWDKVDATAKRRGFNGTNASVTNNTTHEREDKELSYTLGLVHKFTPALSAYAAYGNAYIMSANFDRNSIQLAGGGAAEAIVGAGFSTPPEQIQAYEAGVKWRVAAGLDVAAAMFRTETSKGRIPAQAAGAFATPNSEYHVNGVELLAAGKITNRWQLYSGYAWLRSKVTASPALGSNAPYVIGQELGGTPRHSFNLFTTYDVTPSLTLGGGVQYSGSVFSSVDLSPTDNVNKVRVDSWTVADLYAAYKFSKQTQLRLNLNNVFDKKYIAQLAEGGGQGIPGKARQAILTLRHDF